eukprot:TRINITY_DN9427_c0_g1_i4.p1 TRINITY_DN9427_c0_g1~~TRINITY_DN9427_c0_g1_i4.p1  ORF type:complete len:243 (+),score=41.59 TRINITY_DN9427_c0_g1_i4:101-829(+)
MCEKLKGVTCPDCRATFKPRAGASADNFVKSLTTNFWIFQNSNEEKYAYTRRSQVYKKSKEVNKARKEYTEVLISERSDKGKTVASVFSAILKTIFFTIPFFCMIATYLAFIPASVLDKEGSEEIFPFPYVSFLPLYVLLIPLSGLSMLLLLIFSSRKGCFKVLFVFTVLLTFPMLVMSGYYQYCLFTTVYESDAEEVLFYFMGIITIYLMLWVFVVRVAFTKLFYTAFPFSYFYFNVLLSK